MSALPPPPKNHKPTHILVVNEYNMPSCQVAFWLGGGSDRIGGKKKHVLKFYQKGEFSGKYAKLCLNMYQKVQILTWSTPSLVLLSCNVLYSGLT